MRTAARVTSIVLLVCLLAPMLLAACPLCKEEASDADRGGPSLWRGMFWSILLMIATPFTMVGTMILLVLRARRRHAAASGPGSSSSSPPPLAFPDSRGARP